MITITTLITYPKTKPKKQYRTNAAKLKRDRDRRSAAAVAGLCRRCCIRPQMEGRVQCEGCTQYDKNRHAAISAARKAEGIHGDW